MVARCRRQAAAAWSGRANGSSSRLPACHIDVSSRAATASQPDRADAVAAWPGRASESSSRLPDFRINAAAEQQPPGLTALMQLPSCRRQARPAIRLYLPYPRKIPRRASLSKANHASHRRAKRSEAGGLPP